MWQWTLNYIAIKTTRNNHITTKYDVKNYLKKLTKVNYYEVILEI